MGTVGLLEWRAPFCSSVFEGLCPSFCFIFSALFFLKGGFFIPFFGRPFLFFCVSAHFFLKGCFCHFGHWASKAFYFLFKKCLYFLRSSIALLYFFIMKRPSFSEGRIFFCALQPPFFLFFLKALFLSWGRYFQAAFFCASFFFRPSNYIA